MKILKDQLDYLDQKTNLLIFLPDSDVKETKTFAVFTHGYTSDKSSILNWPSRLAEVGVATVIFDLPGHYLGNYSEVHNFSHFKSFAHQLFYEAFLRLLEAFKEEFPLRKSQTEASELKLVLGGHSLGAMLSLKALMMEEFSHYTKCCIGVGLGMAPEDIVHLFDTPFYQSTLKIREQLVSRALSPENVFPWIKEEKKRLIIENQDIHLIVGVDDLVVGDNGVDRFAENLMAKGNRVTIEKPSKLPHHEPQLAASHIKKHLKKLNWL